MPAAAYALFYAMLCGSAIYWGRRTDVPTEVPTTQAPADCNGKPCDGSI